MAEPQRVRHVRETACVIAGAGPAGLLLALLLARRGVRVTLLEAGRDFDRPFRGDLIYPAAIEVLEALGLAGRLLRLPHGRVSVLRFQTPAGRVAVGDLRRLRSPFPYIVVLPPARLLGFLAEELGRYPNCHLVMGAATDEVLWSDGRVEGVRYRGADGERHEVRATLTVAADGRASRLRELAGLELARTGPPVDVLWFALPRQGDDPRTGAAGYAAGGHVVTLLDRGDRWQVSYLFPPGAYARARERGFDAFRQLVAERVPFLATRVTALAGWQDCSELEVWPGRLRKWYRPGLLLLGDAAHVMSPLAGVGANCAVQDAVAAANVLAEPLRRGRVRLADLRAVQRLRALPTRTVQALQQLIHRQLAQNPEPAGKAGLPWALRALSTVPGLRNLPLRLLVYGINRPRVQG